MKKEGSVKKISSLTSSRERLSYYLMLMPFGVLFILFMALPVVISIVLSFFSFDTISMPQFIGFQNYLRMFLEDQNFTVVAKNTLILAIIVGPLGFILAFVLAWFINEFRPMVRTVLSFMFYCPALVGNAFYIWQIAFSNDSYGYVNSLLLSMGFITEPINWLKDASYTMPIIIVIQLWMSMGVSFLANISGLQNINSEMYEAGAIDGIRNRWQELWYITLPAMQHMLLFSAVMAISSAFSIGAICVTMAGYPSVENSVDTIVSYLADVGTVKYEMGYACAVSVFLFALMLIFRYIVGKLLNKTGK